MFCDIMRMYCILPSGNSILDRKSTANCVTSARQAQHTS